MTECSRKLRKRKPRHLKRLACKYALVKQLQERYYSSIRPLLAGAPHVVCVLRLIYETCPVATCKHNGCSTQRIWIHLFLIRIWTHPVEGEGKKSWKQMRRARTGSLQAELLQSATGCNAESCQTTSDWEEKQHTLIHWQEKKALSICKAAQEGFTGCFDSVFMQKWAF